MTTRLQNTVLIALSKPWVITAVGALGAAAVLVALGVPADQAIFMAGGGDDGSGSG
ncbi:MAG: hypothetical protein GYB64_06635 [Chloroflexi bacterium]|nr:hypothetical protein [Chloroflexota bacterium]